MLLKARAAIRAIVIAACGACEEGSYRLVGAEAALTA
jgi:hypothetical protein